MRQPYVIIDGKRYDQGAVFVIKSHDGISGIEKRMTFVYYDTEHNYYCFITPTIYNADSTTIYPDTRFMEWLIRVDSPTDRETVVLQHYWEKNRQITKKSKFSSDNDNTKLLLMFGLLVLFAVLPPVGVIVVLCIVFSDGTTSGFLGCLTPFLVLVGIALIMTIFN